MFPQTPCLHHGLKATYFPHPIFANRDRTAEALQKTFNPGPFGQVGGILGSTFSKWNEDAWPNTTWFFNSVQAKPIFERLLSVAAENTGGTESEEAYGRTVIRPMLLHPVKSAKSERWTEDGWVTEKREEYIR